MSKLDDDIDIKKAFAKLEVNQHFTSIDVQQTNCLYTEHGQRIAYYHLPGKITAMLDIDRGIYAFVETGSIYEMHQAYLHNDYELWHDKYTIGWRTIRDAKTLDYPALRRS